MGDTDGQAGKEGMKNKREGCVSVVFEYAASGENMDVSRRTKTRDE